MVPENHNNMMENFKKKINFSCNFDEPEDCSVSTQVLVVHFKTF